MRLSETRLGLRGGRKPHIVYERGVWHVQTNPLHTGFEHHQAAVLWCRARQNATWQAAVAGLEIPALWRDRR